MYSIPDKLNMLSVAHAFTATAASQNSIQLDATVTTNGQAPARELFLAAEVATTFTGLTSVAVQYQTSDDNSTWTTLAQTDAIPVASLVAGYKFVPIAVGSGLKKWVRANYVVVGTGTAGALSSGLASDFPAANTFTYDPLA